MRIRNLELLSNDLGSQKQFFKNQLGLPIINETEHSFSIQIGWSTLSFKYSNEKHPYHYCFLLPSNKLEKALEWFKSRLRLISYEGDNLISFENWNAKSFYFYDGNGNLAECIVRYDLNNNTEGNFELSDLLCVNEIGMSSNKIKKLNDELEQKIGTAFWKGNFERFGTNGNNEGIFLLVNNDVKKTWFPTEIATLPSPFRIEVETTDGSYTLHFKNQELILD